MTPQIYIVKVSSPIDKNTFQFLFEYAQPMKQERILRQKIKQNADNMLIGEILAKVVIKMIFGIDFVQQKFAYTEYGKPYLSDFPKVHFNISHSGEYVACVVSNKPVGVDIQEICEYNSAVAKRVCNDKELLQIENSLDRASEFTKKWTQKEAALKMYGIGMMCSEFKNCLNAQVVKSTQFDNYWLSVCY